MLPRLPRVLLERRHRGGPLPSPRRTPAQAVEPSLPRCRRQTRQEEVPGVLLGVVGLRYRRLPPLDRQEEKPPHSACTDEDNEKTARTRGAGGCSGLVRDGGGRSARKTPPRGSVKPTGLCGVLLYSEGIETGAQLQATLAPGIPGVWLIPNSRKGDTTPRRPLSQEGGALQSTHSRQQNDKMCLETTTVSHGSVENKPGGQGPNTRIFRMGPRLLASRIKHQGTLHASVFSPHPACACL